MVAMWVKRRPGVEIFHTSFLPPLENETRYSGRIFCCGGNTTEQEGNSLYDARNVLQQWNHGTNANPIKLYPKVTLLYYSVAFIILLLRELGPTMMIERNLLAFIII